MYAIVSTGGKQYKVATDDVITVEKIEGEAGSKVELEVIFLNDGKKIVTDPAKLAKAKVTAEILEQFKGEKQLVYKFHKRKRYPPQGPPSAAHQAEDHQGPGHFPRQEDHQGRGARGSRRRVVDHL